MIGDELGHLIRQLAGQQDIEFRPLAYAHIASYDASTHRIRVIVPSLRDDDPAPTLSGWIPMVAGQVGNGYGVQSAPFGGATVANPTGGEQVILGLFDKMHGVVACLGQTFNGVSLPPATALSAPVLPGETVIFNKAGSFVRLHANGDVEVNTKGKTLVNAVGDVNIVTAGNVNLGALGGRKIARDGDSVSTGGTIQATTTKVFSA